MKIGTKITVQNPWMVKYTITVVRETKTLWIAKSDRGAEYRFSKKSEVLRPIGGSIWDTITYEVIEE